MESVKEPSVRVGFRLSGSESDRLLSFSPERDKTRGLLNALRLAELHRNRRNQEVARIVEEIKRLKEEYDVRDEDILDLREIKASAVRAAVDELKREVRNINRSKVKAFIREYQVKT